MCKPAECVSDIKMQFMDGLQLSRIVREGMPWITIGEEVEQIRSYLTIQRIRYQDMLDYKIEVDEAVSENLS